MHSSPSYIGRFAPSPSGPLHFGSLVTALASFLQARQQGGKWFIRIDDIDPPREVPGAADGILICLQQHGLLWDGQPLLQSTRHQRYQQVLNDVVKSGGAYSCECTRKQIKQLGDTYQRTCRDKQLATDGHAIRFKNDKPVVEFTDNLLGDVSVEQQQASEDFVLRRRDGLFGYHLVSVIDDIDMGVTEIVRGADLLMPSACQMAFFSYLGAIRPCTVHIPVATYANGLKLSKQNHAPSIADTAPADNLLAALSYLGQALDEEIKQYAEAENIEALVQCAIDRWDLQSIPKQRSTLVNVQPT